MENKLSKAVTEANQRLVEMESCLEEILEKANVEKVEHLLEQVRMLETQMAESIPLKEVVELENQMSDILTRTQSKVVSLQNHVATMEKERVGEYEQSNHKVRALVQQVREVEMQVSQTLNSKDMQSLQQDVIKPLLDAQGNIAQLQVNMSKLKNTIMDESGEKLLDKTRQLEGELAIMISPEELEEVVQSQRAALFDITAATFTAGQVPFKRESQFKLNRDLPPLASNTMSGEDGSPIELVEQPQVESRVQTGIFEGDFKMRRKNFRGNEPDDGQR